MSFFGRIKSAIFGKSEAAPSAAPPPSTRQASAPTSAPAPTPAASAATPAASAATPAAPAPAGGKQAQTSPAAAPVGGASTQPQVDVVAVLTELASKRKEKLDWRKSIVDLLKLLDLDSSLSARKELAKELNYSGDTNDSAGMNMWLHKQVMRKLAENGGKVPDDLRH
jgi:hypothetical protein